MGRTTFPRSRFLRHAGRVAAWFGIAVIAACATPTDRYEWRAAALGLDAMRLPGEGFDHRAFAAGLALPSDSLHVYVEHDGTPWIGYDRVAADPTPRVPFALELMARDSGPRLLLGRPCQFDPRGDSACAPQLWTQHRYSALVVASMTRALRKFLALHPFRQVVLVGYSGGGTLAWLMAGELPEAVGVVTVAANLDVGEWARLHDYSPLQGSLDPARAPPLRATIEQLHYVGGRDANVPPAVVASFARAHSSARVVEIAAFDHVCCWIDRWPELLARRAPPAGRAARAPRRVPVWAGRRRARAAYPAGAAR
jgi:pimeloyl-ACP methyl ester carboxylesterase